MSAVLELLYLGLYLSIIESVLPSSNLTEPCSTCGRNLLPMRLSLLVHQQFDLLVYLLRSNGCGNHLQAA